MLLYMELFSIYHCTITGHAEDDGSAAQTQPPRRCEKPPPEGGASIPRAAAMLGHFLETLGGLLNAVVKEDDAQAGQTDVKDSAVIKNGEDLSVSSDTHFCA